jgi:hypothetical protein
MSPPELVTEFYGALVAAKIAPSPAQCETFGALIVGHTKR